MTTRTTTRSEAPCPPLRRGRHRAGLPGNVDMITGSALTPVLESVAALPAGHPADLPVTAGVDRLLRSRNSSVVSPPFHPSDFLPHGC